MSNGVVEVISTNFVIGWAESSGGRPAHVYATVGGEILGFAKADLLREDLFVEGVEVGRAFIILFDSPIEPEKFDQLEVHALHTESIFRRWKNMRTDRVRPLQIFVLGSPRSGTSELARTIANEFSLAWLGEAHAAPAFAHAADALAGAIRSPHDMLRFMAQQSFRRIGIEAMQKAYYFMHGSTSFIDKTPGAPMIEVAPFLNECFPAAKIIYMRRNGISNVLSRMKKFGGEFHEHCADWVAAIESWDNVKQNLPHYLEVDQEIMLSGPEIVARELCKYLETPDKEETIAQSLRTGSAERTGAGVGRYLLSSTGWSVQEIETFTKICGLTMLCHDYPMD
jgi:hypothetical protein